MKENRPVAVVGGLLAFLSFIMLFTEPLAFGENALSPSVMAYGIFIGMIVMVVALFVKIPLMPQQPQTKRH